MLPKGVWVGNFRYGVVSELTNRYDQSGSLQSISRLNQAFNGENIGKFSPDFKNFSNFLAKTYPHHGFVNQLSIGQLEFDADVEARYAGVVLARGITKSFTLGIGAPIVSLKADVSVKQTGTNTAAAICNNFTPDQAAINTTMADGCAKLQSANLISEYKQTMQNNGYQEPTSSNQTVLGDLQIAGIYQYFSDKKWTLYNQTILNLPTGPEDDPSNFLDIPIFHQTNIRTEFKQDFRITPRWTFGTMVGYIWRIPDQAEKRVPTSRDDMLPAASRQERVSRNLGDSWLMGSSMGYALTQEWSVLGSYEYSTKNADSYRGVRGYDYGLLAKDSKAEAHRVAVGVTFSTIDMFYAREFMAPLQIGYTFSDVISGVNTDRQQAHEISLRMFF